jgi:hypothetical protein
MMHGQIDVNLAVPVPAPERPKARFAKFRL